MEKLKKLKEQCGGFRPVQVRPEMRFGDWLEYWYQNFSKPKLRQSTQLSYEGWICNRLIPGVGDISYEQKDMSIVNEADWPRMAKFHARWSDAICNAVLPYLQSGDEQERRLSEIAGILREWTVIRPEVKENLAKCNRTLTRFTTEQMSEIFPDIPDAPSGWGTDNHYFYEIVNRTGDKIHIQLALSARNATEGFRNLCDRVRVRHHYANNFG